MINSWMQMGYSEKKAIKWYEKYGEFEKSKEQSLEQMKILNNELDAYRDTVVAKLQDNDCLLYTSPSPRDRLLSRMPSSA